MNIIFQIDGGLGKSIMATAICESIKKAYSDCDIFVVTAYPEVFLCNPNVKKVYAHNNMQYFYKDVIEDKEIKAFIHNPYFETSFINQSKHLLETWCEMFGLRYQNEQPKIYLTEREKGFYSNQFTFNKPLMVIQTNGGAENQANKYSWARDIPIGLAQHIVNDFSNEYDIAHIRRNNQIALENTTPIEANFRALATLILGSQKRLFIDSFAQHTATALGLSSVVVWGANKPSQFGYESNTNIVANPETKTPELKFSQYSKYNISGDMVEFPYNHESEIFDADKIIEALKK
jgi:ADP-heptose:LPS heptosyltransferase